MKSLLILILLLISAPMSAAIYEDDGRQIAFSSQHYQEFNRSILAQLRPETLIAQNEDFYVKTKTLNDHVGNLCEETNFRELPTFSRCTAFLVAEDLLVTAGHCINNESECSKATWIFSDEIDPSDMNPKVEKQDVVKCKSVVSRVKNPISKNDYALIKITSPIKHRPYLKLRSSGKIPNNDELLVIGHPTGLPLMISDHNKILDNSSEFLFKINSDTFGGNSGSPVINMRTGLVEGILTDGDLDYILDPFKGCKVTYKCGENKCKGENVVRITNIPQLVPNMTPIEPIFDPRLPRL